MSINFIGTPALGGYPTAALPMATTDPFAGGLANQFLGASTGVLPQQQTFAMAPQQSATSPENQLLMMLLLQELQAPPQEPQAQLPPPPPPAPEPEPAPEPAPEPEKKGGFLEGLTGVAGNVAKAVAGALPEDIKTKIQGFVNDIPGEVKTVINAAVGALPAEAQQTINDITGALGVTL